LHLYAYTCMRRLTQRLQHVFGTSRQSVHTSVTRKMSASSVAASSNGLAASPATRLQPVSDKVDFSSTERATLDYWERIQAFEQSLQQSAGRPIYTFYDGPPFATGLPHYGHILAGTIKDTVTRYAHQTGHHVVRRFGWDAHGLPVEFEIDQKLNIKSKDDVMKIGVAAYNAECRSIVQRYTKEWERTVKRMGRWIDFKNDYKTMDLNYMESVWWVFSQLHAKGLVYRGYKVMPYSTGCTTPLSNFEAGLNYKDVSDPAITVSFKIAGKEEEYLVAWTTTPWTLPSNLALAVNGKFTYARVRDSKSGNVYVILKSRITELYPPKKGPAKPAPGTGSGSAASSSSDAKDKSKEKDKKNVAVSAPTIATKTDEYEILEEFPGTQLVGTKYEPLFPYFASLPSTANAFRVIAADYVSDDSGTGVVHQAPGFGEDDYHACAANGIIKVGDEIVCPVDGEGRFTQEVKDFAGRYVKEADKDIIAWLKGKGRLVKQNQIVHSYPFCWRSETPLLYKAVPSWFIHVEKIKSQLLESNAQTYWVPDFVKEKRFHNWLSDARDWAVSRNRYWGTPLPIWQSEDGKEIVVIGSIEQLKQLSGEQNITDLHKDKIDHITIPSQRGKEFGVLRRTEEVFDCWFESGSMPYAQLHYPFENESYFDAGFPADFIAEGLDQTRGWFYTLMVISTGLFGKPAFKNLIVNGLVLASDGKKMSKRLKNYPDPGVVVDKYGADALRLYLINSPVVRAEPLRFQEAGVHDVVKTVCLPWFHAYRFLVENVLRYEAEQKGNNKFSVDLNTPVRTTNVMDLWILSAFQSLLTFVHQEMAAYRLYTVVPKLLLFIDQLTNWYVRMNRQRLKGKFGVMESEASLTTLTHVLINLCMLMAPFTPFFVEHLYQNLKSVLPKDQQLDSVHFALLPQPDEAHTNPKIERRVGRMQTVIELGRTARDKRKLTMKRPLKSVLIVHKDAAYLDDIRSLATYVRDELNVRTVEVSSEVDKFIRLKALPNRRALGTRFGKRSAAFAKAIQEWSHDSILSFQNAGGKKEVDGEVLTNEEVEVSMLFQGDKNKMEDCGNNDVLVIINVEEDAELIEESMAREVTRRVQQLRKAAGLAPTDEVEFFYHLQTDVKDKQNGPGSLMRALQTQSNFIRTTLGRTLHPAATLKPKYAVELARGDLQLEGEPTLTLIVTRLFVSVNTPALESMGLSASAVETASLFLAQKEWHGLKSDAQGDKVHFNVDGKEVTLVRGKHYFLHVQEFVDATTNSNSK